MRRLPKRPKKCRAGPGSTSAQKVKKHKSSCAEAWPWPRTASSATLPDSSAASYEVRQETPVDQLLKQVVAPHVVPAKDPRQDVLIAAVDSAISETMRRVLHHPDLQTTEALWRSVDLLVHRLETSVTLQIVLYDITAEGVAADLSADGDAGRNGPVQVAGRAAGGMDTQPGAVSAIVGNYLFEHTPPHAELLGRMGKIAAAAQKHFITAISAACLQKGQDRDLHALIVESWSAVQAAGGGLSGTDRTPLHTSESLRPENGSDRSVRVRGVHTPVRPARHALGQLGHSGRPLAGADFAKQGLKKMNVGSILSVDDMPYYYFSDRDGDQVALPCTERLLDCARRRRYRPKGGSPHCRSAAGGGSFGRPAVLGGTRIVWPLAGPGPSAGHRTAEAASCGRGARRGGGRHGRIRHDSDRPRRIWTLVRPPTTRPRHRPLTRATAIWMPCWRVWAVATRSRKPRIRRAARKWIRTWRPCWPRCDVVLPRVTSRLSPHLCNAVALAASLCAGLFRVVRLCQRITFRFGCRTDRQTVREIADGLPIRPTGIRQLNS